MAHDAATTGAVDDIDRLAEFLLQPRCKNATASVPPPAAQGTIRVTGRSGQAADAARLVAVIAAASIRVLNVMAFLRGWIS
ncbi:hypothetical protein [Bosea sp. 2KB_26]|uniref:hypothetical protein n=1 Tax=Bosea sp. 2KB_26 TaxID=3237475 RepID=UPI003F8DF972